MTCPQCHGAGHLETGPVNRHVGHPRAAPEYRDVRCDLCKGEGRVPIRKAQEWEEEQ